MTTVTQSNTTDWLKSDCKCGSGLSTQDCCLNKSMNRLSQASRQMRREEQRLLLIEEVEDELRNILQRRSQV